MKKVGLLGGRIFVALALTGLVYGCSSSAGGGNRFGELLGRAFAPEADTTVPLANETVVLLTVDENGEILSTQVGTTDDSGEFQVNVEEQAVVALVVNGMTDDGDAEISGLFNPEADVTLQKDLNPGTSIACVAGLSAIGDGSITAEQLDEQRVQNLEDAWEPYLEQNPNFDFYTNSDRDDAVDWVRTETNDGEYPVM
jgi:hypothetical protein